MNGLWRKTAGRRWITGPSFPQLVKNLWITVENKCSEWSCTQKKGLETHILPTDHEYPVEKKSLMSVNAPVKNVKKSPQSMKGLWRKLRVILLFQFFQMLLQNEIDILRNGAAVVISVLSNLFQNVAVDGYADFFL